MTIGLQITDGTTTLDLNDGAYFETMKFDPGAGDVSAEFVSGSLELYINGTKSQIQTELAAFQKMLQKVIEYSGTGAGGALYSALDKRIYLNYRTDNSEAYYRSPLYRMNYTVEPQSYEVLNFDCGGIIYTIDFERCNWWEGAEAQLALTTHLETNVLTRAEVWNPAIAIQTKTTISFETAGSKIKDSANGLAKFLTGDTIRVLQSSANDGAYTVATGGVAGEIVTVQAIADEAAGQPVSIVGATCNWVSVTGADVGGDLPAATLLHIQNIYNDTDGTDFIWIGQNYTDPANFSHLLECELAGTGATAIFSHRDTSNGQYNQTTVASGSEIDLFIWTLTTAQLNAAAGRWFKALLRDLIGTNLRYFKFRLELRYGGVAIWRGGQVLTDSNYSTSIRDLLTFQLPPGMGGQTGMGDLDLVLTGEQSTGSAKMISLDYLQLTPVDGYRFLAHLGPGVEYLRRVVDDGITPVLYEDDNNGTERVPTLVGQGSPIMLQPGRTQRLYFLSHGNSGYSSSIIRTLGIKLYYRPRRLTI